MRKNRNPQQNNRLIRLFTIVVFLLSTVGMISVILYADKKSDEYQAVSFDFGIDSGRNESIYITIDPGTAWTDDDGDNLINRYSMEIVNNSRYDIHNWSVTIQIVKGCSIDSCWNGSWEINGTELIYTPDELSGIVRPGETCNFGLIMYSPKPCDMQQVLLEYMNNRQIINYPTFWFFIVLGFAAIATLFVTEVVRLSIKKYSKNHAAYKDLVSESLRTIANVIDTKDEYTKGHSLRVAIYSRMIAEKMGMSAYEQERIYYIGLLHDIGKIGIPASILTKPGRLNDEEFEIIKRHPAMGSQIMRDFSSIPGVQNGIKYHHERYDGKGYNEGLAGNDIPLEGRIICVADSYDAMSSKRCYRNSLSYDFILDELKRNAGTQFDPDILKHMVSLIEEGYAPISDAEMEDYEI